MRGKREPLRVKLRSIELGDAGSYTWDPLKVSVDGSVGVEFKHKFGEWVRVMRKLLICRGIVMTIFIKLKCWKA